MEKINMNENEAIKEYLNHLNISNVGEMKDYLSDMIANWKVAHIQGCGQTYTMFNRLDENGLDYHFHVVVGKYDKNMDLNDAETYLGMPYESVVQGYANFNGMRIHVWGPEMHYNKEYWDSSRFGNTPDDTLVFPPAGHFEYLDMADIAKICCAINEMVLAADFKSKDVDRFPKFTVAENKEEF